MCDGGDIYAFVQTANGDEHPAIGVEVPQGAFPVPGHGGVVLGRRQAKPGKLCSHVTELGQRVAVDKPLLPRLVMILEDTQPKGDFRCRRLHYPGAPYEEVSEPVRETRVRACVALEARIELVDQGGEFIPGLLLGHGEGELVHVVEVGR